MAKFPTFEEMCKNVAEEALDGYIYKGKTLRKWIDVLAQTRWIPVSERLPKKDKYKDFYKCLVAIRCTSRHDICDTVTAYFDGKHFYSYLYDRCFIEGVIAWMPLPEPYKEEIINRNLCDSCTNYGCILQSGIVRNHCDFYIAESEK